MVSKSLSIFNGLRHRIEKKRNFEQKVWIAAINIEVIGDSKEMEKESGKLGLK